MKRHAVNAVGAGFAYALTTWLSFPPASLWPTVFVAVVPLIWLASRTSRPHRAGLFAALGALPLWLYEMQYVVPISAAGYWPMTAVLALFTWLFVASCAAVHRAFPKWSLPAAAIVWSATELVRGTVAFDGLPWFYLSHPLIAQEKLAAPARLIGAAGLMVVVAFANAAIAAVLLAPAQRRVRAASGLVVVGVLWAVLSYVGHRAGEGHGEGSVRAAILQTNLPQSNKMAWPYEQRLAEMRRYLELTERACAADPRPEVVVWPETMFPGTYLDDQANEELDRAGITFGVRDASGQALRYNASVFRDELLRAQGTLGVPIVVGAIGADGFRVSVGSGGVELHTDRRFNSAFVIDGGRVQPGRFDKIALTPFGEYMPVVRRWPWLQKQLLAIGARGMAFDLAEGTRWDPLELPVRTGAAVRRFAAPICFEVTRAEHVRDLVFRDGRRSASLFINLTNDGWFGAFDSGRRQHLQLARWRCLELGTPMIRAANTGISAVIDSRGRVIASGVDGVPGAIGVEGILSADVPNFVEDTPYARYGDRASGPVLAAGVLIVAGAGVVNFRRTRAARMGSRN